MNILFWKSYSQRVMDGKRQKLGVSMEEKAILGCASQPVANDDLIHKPVMSRTLHGFQRRRNAVFLGIWFESPLHGKLLGTWGIVCFWVYHKGYPPITYKVTQNLRMSPNFNG